jgi:hypothetical protein
VLQKKGTDHNWKMSYDRVREKRGQVSRKRIVKKFTNRQGLLILVAAALVSILLLWLMLSGNLRIDRH